MDKGGFEDITFSRKKTVPAGVDAFANRAKVDGTKPQGRQLTKRLIVEIPEEKFNSLKAKTAAKGLKLRKIVESWVDDFLAE